MEKKRPKQTPGDDDKDDLLSMLEKLSDNSKTNREKARLLKAFRESLGDEEKALRSLKSKYPLS